MNTYEAYPREQVPVPTMPPKLESTSMSPDIRVKLKQPEVIINEEIRRGSRKSNDTSSHQSKPNSVGSRAKKSTYVSIRKPPAPIMSESFSTKDNKRKPKSNKFKRRHSSNASQERLNTGKGALKMNTSKSHTRKISSKRTALRNGEFSSTAASQELLNITGSMRGSMNPKAQAETASASRSRSGTRQQNVSDSNIQTVKNNYSSMVLDGTMNSEHLLGSRNAVNTNRSSLEKFLREEEQRRRVAAYQMGVPQPLDQSRSVDQCDDTVLL